MGTSSTFLCLLYLSGALAPTDFSTSPAPRRLHSYTCDFAQPCYLLSTECQDDEAFGISIRTSEQSESTEWRGCLPRSQCPLQGHATYWSCSYTLLHRCCEQDLSNGRSPAVASQPPLPHRPAPPRCQLCLGRPPLPLAMQICSPQPRMPPPSP